MVDQTTFAPDPEPPAPAQVATTAQADRRVPLLTVRFDVPNPAYGDLLRYAVQTAEARDPNVQYDVVTVVPFCWDFRHIVSGGYPRPFAGVVLAAGLLLVLAGMAFAWRRGATRLPGQNRGQP